MDQKKVIWTNQYTVRSAREYFEDRVEKSEGCWPWRGPIDKATGYGIAARKRGRMMAHQLSYRLYVGTIPKGCNIDHVLARGCTRKDCVNPAHLEAVPYRVNTLRGPGPSAINARKTHCDHGHPFDVTNTYVYTKNGLPHRACRICRREARRRCDARNSPIRQSIGGPANA